MNRGLKFLSALLTTLGVYILLLLLTIGLDALGTSLYGWNSGGWPLALVSWLGLVFSFILGFAVWEEWD